MILGGRAFGRWLGHTGRVFMNGISVLMKEALERYLAPSHHVRTVWTSRAFRTVRHEFKLLPRLVFCYRNLNGPRQGYFFIMFQTWAFPGSWLLLFQVWDIWGIKKKTQATNHHVLFKVSRSLAGLLSSFHLSESSYVCFVYNVRSFWLYLAGGIGKSISTLFFSKCKFSFSVFDVTVWLMSC